MKVSPTLLLSITHHPSPATRRAHAYPGVHAMAAEHLVTVTVSAELAEAFEAHAHQLAPGSIVSKDTSGPHAFWHVYSLNHPGAPPGAVSMVPVWQSVRHGDGYQARLLTIDWYDAHDRRVPGPDLATAHGTAH